MRRLIWIAILLSPLPSFGDCRNFIAESEIPNAIALSPGAGSKLCGATDPCICFDGIKWETAVYDSVAKKLSTDPTKLAAYQAAQSAAATAQANSASIQQARETRLKALILKLKAGTLTTADRQEIVEKLILEVMNDNS